MVHINLLPWREEERVHRLNEFYAMLAAGVIVAVFVSAAIHIMVSGWIDYQLQRNQKLSAIIAVLDKDIAAIDQLEKEKESLIQRTNIITDLQESRPEIVHLFDELVNTVPDGVYLTKLTQKGRNLTIEGRAQSETRVAAYMRNINGSKADRSDASKWLESANLQVVEQKSDSKEAAGSEYRRFVMTVQQTNKNEGKNGKASKPVKSTKAKPQKANKSAD